VEDGGWKGTEGGTEGGGPRGGGTIRGGADSLDELEVKDC
jgi:hypothetical protein